MAIRPKHLRLAAEGRKDNPVRAFYRDSFERYNASERPSWDLIAELYAVRDLSDSFSAVSGGKCVGREDGSNQWLPGVPSNHACLEYRMPPRELAAVLENLLLTPPFRWAITYFMKICEAMVLRLGRC